MEDKSSVLMIDLMNTSVCGYIFTFLLGVGVFCSRLVNCSIFSIIIIAISIV